MSRKYDKKIEKKYGMSKFLWIPMFIVLVVLVAVLVRSPFLPNLKDNESTEDTMTSTTEATTSANMESTSVPEETTIPEEEYLLSIDKNIKIQEIGSYSGPYIEDGSNEPVENVLQILIKNIGSEPMQYAKIAVLSDDEEAVFEMTTLFPGESMIVLEANRKTYSENTEYHTVRTDHIAYFQYEPTMHADKLTIQPLDGGFNIKNISDENIDGKIVIYFKNYTENQYVGGITYSGTIQNGMKADEIKQIMSEKFSSSNTKVVFIKIG